MLAARFERIIFLVDMDSFYASCEMSQRPDLKSQPFVVGADPLEGKGRGVVLACNYPARKFGLRSGMPISTAWKLCPQAHFCPPRFELYEEVSRRVMSLLKMYADKLEQVSIDEAYLEVTDRVRILVEEGGEKNAVESIQSLSDSIKKSISEKEKITCSIGVADSKIVAKIAADVQKPNGLTIVTPEKTLDFLGTLEVSKIPGVGHVSQKLLLDKLQVKTIADLRNVSMEDLKGRFGKSSMWLYNVARGIDTSPVVERSEPVSISGETTFFEDLSDYSKVRAVMQDVADDVHGRTLLDGFVFKAVGIKIRFSGFETHTRSKTLNSYTNSKEILNRETEKLLSEFYNSGKKVRLIGLRVSTLQKDDNGQKTLLEFE